MSLRFEVELPNGKVYKIGGIPLLPPEKLKDIAPDLSAALESDSDELEALTEKAFQIIKFYNPGASKDGFFVDLYTLQEIMQIWSGSKIAEKKTVT